MDPAALRKAAGVLDDTGRALFGHAADLEQAPDAGRSSGELAAALACLATAVAGVAEHLGSLSDAVSTVADDFAGTDQGVSGAMGRRRAVIGP